MRKRYNPPHRSRVVKTLLSEEEYADFTERLAPYGISQSEFLRQAIRRATIRPVIHVSVVNDELLAAVGRLTAEYRAAEQYLLFQHDEFTMKPVLDENGRFDPRDYRCFHYYHDHHGWSVIIPRYICTPPAPPPRRPLPRS